MSRQADRRGEELGVRVSWLESDLDRVDEEFTRTKEAVTHAKTNLNMALQGLEIRVKEHTNKLESKLDQIVHEHKAEMRELEDKTSTEVGGNRKLMTGLLVSMLLAAVSFISVVITMRGGG